MQNQLLVFYSMFCSVLESGQCLQAKFEVNIQCLTYPHTYMSAPVSSWASFAHILSFQTSYKAQAIKVSFAPNRLLLHIHEHLSGMVQFKGARAPFDVSLCLSFICSIEIYQVGRGVIV